MAATATDALAQLFGDKPRRSTKRRFIVIKAATLSDGTKIDVGGQVDEDYWGKRERADCFAPIESAQGKAAQAAYEQSCMAERARAKPKRRFPLSPLELEKAKQAIDRERFPGERARPAWVISGSRTFDNLEIAERRQSTSPYVVKLSHFAHDLMLQDTELDVTHERGGGLVGIVDHDRTIRVTDARPTSPACRSGYSALAPDVSGDFVWARQVRESCGDHIRHVGSWHSHPSGSLNASDADIRYLSNLAVETDADIAPIAVVALGLIVGFRDDRAMIEAYVVRREHNWREQLVCEKATVTQL